MSRLFIIIGVILLVAIAAFGYLVVRRARTTPSAPATSLSDTGIVSTDGQSSPSSPSTDGGASPVVATPTPLPPETVSREVFVRNFVERYGSYSTDAAYDNYRRTRDMMTERLWSEAERAMTKKVTGEFVQVLTRVQSVRVKEESGDRVVMIVFTTREEERGAREPVSTRKIAEVTLVKAGDAWKADRVTWK